MAGFEVTPEARSERISAAFMIGDICPPSLGHPSAPIV